MAKRIIKQAVQDVVTNWCAIADHCEALTIEELHFECPNIPENRGDYSRESWDAIAA